MIGVSATPADLPVAEEFFELFKTPWERAVPTRHYAAVVSTNGCIENLKANLFVMYGSEEQTADAEVGLRAGAVSAPAAFGWNGATFPLFGRGVAFEGRPDDRDLDRDLTLNARQATYRHHLGARRIARVGYDLFREVGHLLTHGQPAEHAATPTLELHIAVLRDLLARSGVPFVEIPPRPQGFDFACCLTHDVDFYGIRRHGFDPTVAGFVGRAAAGSVANLLLGRRTPGELLRNWAAVASLPLVHLGLARDFWSPLADYAEADGGRPATYFMLPFGGRPGVAPDGTVAEHRAAPYGVGEIRADVRAAAGRGAEMAVHGIDAWRDAGAGRAEMSAVSEASGVAASGVRMHWLYSDAQTPERLEAAGFQYDSTWGYNAAIGYRSGTTQAFKLSGTRDLLELQLSIMDTALYYRDRMWLTPAEAERRCGDVIAAAHRFGGAVVINWHDRSLAPERLWGARYRALLAQVEAAGRPWFATASDAVNWFRWRRSVRFTVAADNRTVTISAAARPPHLPGATVTRHTSQPAHLAVDGRQPMTVDL